MIRFEVSGETAEEFAENAMKAWGLMSIGLHNALLGAKIATQTSPTTEPSPPPMSMSSTTTSAPPLAASTPSSTPAKIHSDEVDDLFTSELPEAAPQSTSESSSKKSTAGKQKAPKLDDLKTRLSEVISAAAERWDVKRANAYARKLLKEFGVEKVGNLPPAAFNSFMDLAEEYVDGSAPE